MKKIIFFLILIAGFMITGCTSPYKDITAKMPDLTQFNDGVYRGVYDLSGTPVVVTLDVKIRNNKVFNIEIIKHVCSPVGNKAESIIHDVTKKQSLDVDIVSGATASSKAILKAIENALQ